MRQIQKSHRPVRITKPSSIGLLPNLMKTPLFLFFLTLVALAMPASAKPPQSKRIVFLGDSITHAGQYIEYVETVLMADTDLQHTVLDLGLSRPAASSRDPICMSASIGFWPRPSPRW